MSKQVEHVSFVCPLCWETCGWDDKRGVYDAVQVPSDEGHLQYAHLRCVEERRSKGAQIGTAART